MAIVESYLSFIEICKKPGIYVDKKCNLYFKITKDYKVLDRSYDGKWELRSSPIRFPNKKRFLRYSNKQASKL